MINFYNKKDFPPENIIIIGIQIIIIYYFPKIQFSKLKRKENSILLTVKIETEIENKRKIYKWWQKLNFLVFYGWFIFLIIFLMRMQLIFLLFASISGSMMKRKCSKKTHWCWHFQLDLIKLENEVSLILF